MKCVTGRIDIEKARRYFSYDPETGVITRSVATGGQLIGAIVGTVRRDGYLSIGCQGAEILLHRLAWILYYGEEASDEIDHKDGDRANCRISNLRKADRALNNQNKRKAYKNNELGILGVRRLDSGVFLARIRVNKKLIRLGRHATAELAASAYINAKRELHKGNTL